MGYRADTDAALAQERASYDATIESLVADIVERDSRIASYVDQILALQAELEDCRSQGKVVIPPGTSIQAAIDANPEGTHFRLSGTYHGKNIAPKTGMVFEGPAFIVPGGTVSNNDDGFRCKASGQAFDVTFINLDISGYGRHGIGSFVGTSVIGGRLHHNGKDGIGGDYEGLTSSTVVDAVELDHNGSDYWLGAGSGGAKFFHSHGVTVTNCFVHDNIGNGLWCDAQCGDWFVLDNLITRNTRKGVFYEKGGASDGSFLGRTYAVYEGVCEITGNTITDNNIEGKDNAHPGVALYSSKNVIVEGNYFEGNGNAVIVRDDPKRLTDDKHGWVPENIYLRGNSYNGDSLVGCDLPGVTCE